MGNEDADKIARNAALSETIVTQKFTISKTEAKTEIKQYCMKLWEDQYQAETRGSQYKMFQPSIKQNGTPSSDRTATSVILRLRSGHCRLNSHLYRIGTKESPNCGHCQTQETVEHFLISCPQYESQRTDLKGTARLLNVPLTLHTLLTVPELMSRVVIIVLSCRKLV